MTAAAGGAAGGYRAALDRFLHEGAGGWGRLPFFASGEAARLCALLDRRVSDGGQVLPRPDDLFRAFSLTPLAGVRVVILGQDPYPTPGHAHGLAFSYAGDGSLPASLRNIRREMEADLGRPCRPHGDLSHWAREGVLLMNTALSVEAGAAGAHLKLGWDRLADEALAAVSAARPHAVFILWGGKAAARRALVDESRHLVIASAHPSPLSARTGFFGSRPFSRTNAWLETKGESPVAWL